MNILILGSGGREHALTWKLAQSKKINKIFIGPGNAGTSSLGTNLRLDPENFSDVKAAVVENNINIVIVGPEAPLTMGIHDFFLDDSALKKIPVIGPDKSAARLEGSKDFSKDFLIRHKIPTSVYKSFDKNTYQDVPAFLRTLTPPYVIKADGLAAGKGVVDLFELIEGVANGDLSERKIEIDERFVTAVMLVSGGYPGNYDKGKSIEGLDLTRGSEIFHAGTRREGEKTVTSGGRVLAVSSWGSDIKAALDTSYRNAELINFEGRYFRTDIGFDL